MFRTSVLVLLSGVCLCAQEKGKQFRPGEFERYNDVIKDINSAAFPKAIGDLDAWKQHDPDSEYKDERDALYVQAYAGANEPGKTLDVAGALIARDAGSVFPGAAGQPVILRLLYSSAWAITRLPNPTPGQLAAGEKAARQLISWETPLPGVAADQWAAARADMRQKATAALVYLAMLPGTKAMQKQPPDCAAADKAYTAALGQYPEQSLLSYELARALVCETKTDPHKQVAAIYEFQRAAAIDPTLGGGSTDPKQITSFADSVYSKFHGSGEGLERLRQMVKGAPLPPADFTIESAEEIAARKQNEFETANPQLALWIKIRTRLSQPDGQQYFDGELKDTAVPQLAGKLVEAKPACRPRELLVAIPRPDSATPAAEIQLKLDKPLAGAPAVAQDFRWEGVPAAFTAQPFLLTMSAEAAKIEGLEPAACSAAPRTRTPGK